MTPELMAQRWGRITASNFHKIVEGGPKAQATYLAQLRAENDTPFDPAAWKPTRSGPTDWGNQWEEEAASRFAFSIGYEVTRPVPFQPHPSLPEIGCSPDGLIHKRLSSEKLLAGVEIKCPLVADIHVSHRTHGLPEKYRAQVQGSMWVMGLQQWWFVSYDPRAVNEDGEVVGSLHFEKITRDFTYVQRLERKLLAFRELLLNGGEPQEFNPESDEIPALF